ncbi:MAG: glycoside hydrolase family 113 [Promethearchaeota archaeon]
MEKRKTILIVILLAILSTSITVPVIIYKEKKRFSWVEGNPYFDFEFAKGFAYLGDWLVNGLSQPRNMEDLQSMIGNGSNYIGLTTFWYQDYLNSTVIYNSSRTHDLGSVGRFIDYIHGNGSKVMFKPMLDISTGEWRSWVIPTTKWWASWRNWTLLMASLAENHSVEIFCVGCEMGNTEGNVSEWRSLIAEIRQIYSGKLTYAANWDAYYRIEWWDTVDYIGIDAWYPLTTVLDPTPDELRESWNGIGQYLEQVAKQWDRPILFTEMGYQSRDGANMMPWDVKFRLVEDWQEQADCYNAFLTSNVYNAPWFAGCFWWAWSTSEDPDNQHWRLSHSPNGKPACDVVNRIYHENRVVQEDLSYWNDIAFTWSVGFALTCLTVSLHARNKRSIKGEKNI